MTTEAGQRRLDADGPSKGRLLIVDDNRDFAAALSNLLALEGYEVDLAHDGDAARAALERFDAEVVLLDLRLEAGSGLDLMAPLKGQNPGLVFVIMTGYAETEAAVEALRRGAYDFLRKPIDDGELLAVLERALERIRLEKAKLAAERALAAKSTLLETTFESMSQGMNVYDADLKLIGFNQKYIEIIGYPPDFIRLGMPFEEIARFRAKRGDYGPVADIEKKVRERVAARLKGKVVRRERTLADGRVIAVRRDPLPDGGFVTILTDITERKRAEREIAGKSALLETTFESMSQGIRVLDSDLNIVAFNRRYVDLWGYPPGFIRVGMALEDIVRFKVERGYCGPGDVEEHVRERLSDKRNRRNTRRETILPDGKVIAANHEAMPSGGYVTTYTDITERKKAEREIAEKSALLETTFETMSQGFAAYDSDLELTAFNQRYLDLRGYPPGFIHVGMAFEQVARFRAERGDYGPGDVNGLMKEAIERVRRRMVEEGESTGPDGMVTSVVHDPMPGGGFVATITDITERKQAEQEIAEKSTLLETTFESMSQGMTVYDADLKLIGFNQKYIEILGYPADFIRIGKPFEEIARFRAERGEYGPGDAEKLAAKSVKSARQGKAMRDELTRPDGAVFAIRRDPLPDGGFVTTLTDITERKKAEEEIAEKSAVLERTFESMSQGIRVLDEDLKIVAFNQRYVDLLCFPPDLVHVGMPFEEIVRFRAERGDHGPVDVEAYVKSRVVTRRRGEAHRREQELPSGIVVFAHHEPIPGSGYITTYTDITERKKAEREIAEKSALLETTFESMSQAIAVFDADLKLIAFNQRYLDIRSYPEGFFHLGQSYEKIVRFNAERGEFGPGDSEKQVRERINHARQGTPWRTEYTRSSGTSIAVRLDPLPGGGFVVTFTDITERKKAEEEIAEKSALIETTLESMSQGITVYDANHGLIAFNRRFVELFDFPPGFIRAGRTFEDLARFLAERGEYGPGEVDELVRKRVATRDRGDINRRERTRPNGTVIWTRRDPMPGGGSVTTYTDITERKRAETALRESEEQLSLLLRSTGEAIYGLNPDGNCTFCNPACLNLLGYDEPDDLLGRNMHDLIHHTRVDGAPYPADECQIYRAFRRGESTEVDDEVLWRRDGTSFPAEYRSFPVRKDGEVVGAVVTFTDITERKRADAALRARDTRLHELQTELLNVSRQSAMGELSSALAHELNQPLAAIMNYVQASRRIIKKGGGIASEKAYQMMDKALDQADRASAIIRGLRGIVEKGETARAESDINKVVEEASALGLIGAARKGIRVDLEFGADLPPVIINEIQIQQVVMNLVRNGVEAMAASKKRDLTIKTALDHGDTVEIAIEDTGPGLAEEVKERLFQPFVSTKAGGMGIGLSISHSIVEAHGGRLWATPNPDGGTVFHFTLPLAPNGAEDNDE
ncbi:MAG: PAS-domain containing protein [Proteobacteria bacterium]|nr:PAS-domain containing protein [Pseudomonadota bacterium]